MIFVRVKSPAGRNIYTDGDFSEADGLAPVTIALQQPGSHVFETRTADGVVDYRGSVSDLVDGQSVTIDLAPVGGTGGCGPKLSGLS